MLLAPRLWGLLALLLMFNLVLAVTQDEHEAGFYDDYCSALREFQTMEPDAALARIQDEQDLIHAMRSIQFMREIDDPEWAEYFWEDLINSYGEDYTFEILRELSPHVRVNSYRRSDVLSSLEQQLEHLQSYPAYLIQVQNNVERNKALSIFNKEGSFASRNNEKTGADFPKEVELRLDSDLALTAFVKDVLGGYSLLVFTLYLTLQFLLERKRGLWSLIHGAPDGRGRLAVKRAFLLLLGVALGTLLLLGGKLLFFALRCGGLGDLSRNVQSLAVFDDFPWVMPVWTFLLGYFLLKILGMWLLGLAVWAILQSVNYLPLALCTAGVALAAEFAMFTFIRDSFVMVVFRYVNLFALVDVPKVSLHYLNLNFFGWPVQGFLLSVFLIPPMVGLLFWLNVLLASRKKPVSRQNSLLKLVDGIRVPFSRAVSRLRLFGMELFKLLWLQKGLLILLLVAVYSFGVLEPQYPDDDLYDSDLAAYEASMQGPITPELLAEVDSRIATYSSYQASETVQTQLGILRQLREKCAQSLAAKDGHWLIDPVPYVALISTPTDVHPIFYQREVAVVLLLALTLLLHSAFSQEQQSRVSQLLQGTPRGGAVLWRKKLGAALLLTVLVWLLFEAGELYQIVDKYGELVLSAPIRSLECFAAWPESFSLGTGILIYLLLRLLAMVAATSIILLISCYSRQNNLSLLLCCAVLVLPACLSYMRMGLLDAISLTLLFSPMEPQRIGFLVAAVLFCVTLLLSYCCWMGRSRGNRKLS